MTDLEFARRNLLLAGLPDDDLRLLLDEGVAIDLELGTVLFEPGQPVEAVHFPLTGVISLVTDLGDGLVVEAVTVGNEGMSGLSVFLGAGTPTERGTVQVSGQGLVVSAPALQRLAREGGPLYVMLRRYTQVMMSHLARNTACNRAHTVQQRAARWLLTTADRMDSPVFELTQHFLAQMLAVRRATVSNVAAGLAAAGCISYSRGTIVILDRAALQDHACSCYQVVRDATERALTTREPATS